MMRNLLLFIATLRNLLLPSKSRSLVVFLFFLLAFTVITKTAIAQNTTITIDKDDYAPGETVHITGTGWTNDDVVTLNIFNKTNPTLNSTNHYLSWNIKPVNGNFTAIWEVTQDELSTSLILTAEGKESGFKYLVSFTDDSNLLISGNVQLANGTKISGAIVTGYTDAAHTIIDKSFTTSTTGAWSLALAKNTIRYVVVTPPVCYSSNGVTLGELSGVTASIISNNEIKVSSGTNGGTCTVNLFILNLNQNTISAPSVTTFCATNDPSDISILGSDMGSGASYQWQQCNDPNNLDNIYAYSDIPGVTSKNYNPGTITATTGYLRKVSGNCASTGSNIVKLSVTPSISNIINASTSTNNCGAISEYNISGTPTGGANNNFTFQWQSSIDGVTFSNITNVTNQNYSPGIINSPIYFRRIVYSGYCTSYSNVLYYNTKSATISGTLTVNAGSTTQLTGSPSGGTWSSGTPGVATVNSSGLVSGVSAGTSIITYTATNGCSNTATVSVTGGTAPTITSFTNSPACYGSGVSVVITGTNFTGANDVKFNGVSASAYTVNSATQITATLPALATTGAISVTTTSGTGTSGSNFVVNPKPTVTVSSNTPICAGSSTVLIAGGATSYSWSPSTGLGVTTGATVTANPSSSTTYTVTGTDGNGCTNTAQVTVTVNPKPTVTVSSNTSICAGSSTQLTADGATSYSWSPSTGLSTTTGSSITASPSSSTTYTVTGTDGNGCTNTAQATVTVNPLPTIFSLTGGGSFCSGDSGADFYLSGSETGVNYQKYNGVTAVGSPIAGTGSALTFSGITVPGSYTVVATRTSGGCTATMTGNPTVISSANPTITLTKTDESCPASNDGTISPTISGGLSNVRYIKLTQKYADYQQVAEIQAFEVFTGTNVATGATATASSVYSNNPGGYGPQKTIDGDTSGSTFWHSNSANINEWVRVDLGTAKNIDYLRIFNRTDVCCVYRGQNMLLELFDAANSLVYSKTIDLRGGGTNVVEINVLDLSWADAGGTTMSRTSLDAGTYTLNYTDAAGCSTSQSATVGTTNTLSTAPTAITGTTTICNGGSTTLSVSGGTLGTGASWKWYTGACGGTASIGLGTSITVSPTSATTYYVRAEGTCNTTVCASATVTIAPIVSTQPLTTY